MKRKTDLTPLFFFSAVVVLFAIFIILFTTRMEVDITDCYDENNNKIIGLECEDEVIASDVVSYIVVVLATIFAILSLLTICCVLNAIKD